MMAYINKIKNIKIKNIKNEYGLVKHARKRRS
jgi:hypothetical protein